MGREPSDGRPSDANPEIKKSRRFISHSSRIAQRRIQGIQFSDENIPHTPLTFNAPSVARRIIRRLARAVVQHSHHESFKPPGRIAMKTLLFACLVLFVAP